MTELDKRECGHFALERFCDGCFEGMAKEIHVLESRLKAADKVVMAMKQMFYNGDHFNCELADNIGPCAKIGGDMMSKCQTCCNKWQAEESMVQYDAEMNIDES